MQRADLLGVFDVNGASLRDVGTMNSKTRGFDAPT